MRTKVKFLQDNPPIKAGEERLLQPNTAINLAKKGVVEIIGTLQGKNKVNFVPEIDVVVTKTEINVTVDEWSDLTKAELIEQCEKKGIEIPKKATKAILIDLLK